jgi:hypothetical protein
VKPDRCSIREVGPNWDGTEAKNRVEKAPPRGGTCPRAMQVPAQVIRQPVRGIVVYEKKSI